MPSALFGRNDRQEQDGQRKFERLLEDLDCRVAPRVADCDEVARADRREGDERESQRKQAERADGARVGEKARTDQPRAEKQKKRRRSAANQSIGDCPSQDGAHAGRVAAADGLGHHARCSELNARGRERERKAVNARDQGKQPHCFRSCTARDRHAEAYARRAHQKRGGGQEQCVADNLFCLLHIGTSLGLRPRALPEPARTLNKGIFARPFCGMLWILWFGGMSLFNL